MRPTSILILSLVVASCGGGDSIRQQFLAQSTVSVQLENWVRSLNNQDMDSLTLTFHHLPELRHLHSDGSISHGWEEVREHYDQFFDAAELVNFVPDGLEIDVQSSEVVLTTFRYTLDIQRAGTERDPTIRGLGTMVWTNDSTDELWKIYLLQLSKR